MKLITNLFIILFLFSCTKQAQKNIDQENDSEINIISYDIVVTDVTVAENPATESVVFRLDSEDGKKVRKRFYIKNETGSSLPISQNIQENLENGYTVTRNVCRSNLASGRSCYIDIEAQYSGTVAEGSSKVFFIDNANDELSNPFVNLVLEIDETYANDLGSIGDAIVKSEEIIDFGTLKKDEFRNKRFYFINTSEFQDLDTPTISTPLSDKVIISNKCGVKIKKLSSCYINIKYSYEGVVGSVVSLNETLGITSENMSEVSKSIIIQASSVEEINPSTPKLNISSINLPSETSQGKFIKRIYVANAVNTPYVFDGSDFISGVSEVKNTCKNLTLEVGKYCYIDVEINVVSNNDPISVVVSIPEANTSETFESTGGAPSVITYGSGILFDSGNLYQ